MSLIEKIARAIADTTNDDGTEIAQWLHDDEIERLAQAALTAIMGEGDGVQEVDKRAANDLLIGDKVGGGDGNTYVLRYPDYNGTAQAFARHRSTAAAAERARIVAGLKAKADIGFLAAAYAIERGEV